MHPERYEISSRLAGLIELVREQGGRVWAVGTTVVRALESAAQPDGTVRAGAGETAPDDHAGLPFRVVDRLLTNFHLPRSTLLMLVSAFAGHELTMAAYSHARGRAVPVLLVRRRDGDPVTVGERGTCTSSRKSALRNLPTGHPEHSEGGMRRGMAPSLRSG